MTTQGNFKVSILRNGCVPALTIPNTYAPFYRMKDKDIYTIVLENKGATKCDARVTIDGEVIGVWRILAGSSAVVRCPTNVAKCLVFRNSSKFTASSATGQLPVNGKISVEFLPELGNTPETPIPYHDYYPVQLKGQNGTLHDLNQSQYGTGTTVLGNPCEHSTELVELIANIDHANKQTIDVWLVEEY